MIRLRWTNLLKSRVEEMETFQDVTNDVAHQEIICIGLIRYGNGGEFKDHF